MPVVDISIKTLMDRSAGAKSYRENVGGIVNRSTSEGHVKMIALIRFRGFAKLKKFKTSKKMWKWVGGSRSHSDKKKLENRPKNKLDGGWVGGGGLSSIHILFGFMEFFKLYKAP